MFENQDKLVKSIRRLIYLGFPRTKVLFTAFENSELPQKWCDFHVHNTDQINRILEQLDQTANDAEPVAKKLRAEHNESLIDALQLINDEFARVQKPLQARECASYLCEFEALSERYAINIGGESDEDQKFLLFDLLHGQKRKLKMDEKIQLDTNCRLVPINVNHFCYVIHSGAKEARKSTVHFVRLNLAEMSCKLIGSEVFKGEFLTLIVDEASAQKFLILADYSGNRNEEIDEEFETAAEENRQNGDAVGITYFYRGQILDSGFLQFEQRLEGKFSCYYYEIWRLENNKLQGLVPDIYQDEEGSDLKYNVITLESNEVKRENVFTTKQEGFCCTDCLETRHFSWLNSNVCYVLYQPWSDENELYKIDLNLKEMTQVDYPGPKRIYGMELDENGVLNLRTSEDSREKREKHSHVWRRFPLINPDTLTNLALAVICEYAFFLDENEKRKFMEKLPQKWRPFSGI